MKETKKELVVYDNDVNEIVLKDMNAKELDLFMFICSKTRNMTADDTTITLHHVEFANAIAYSDKNRSHMKSTVKGLFEKLRKLEVFKSDEKTISLAVMIPYMEYSLDDYMLTLDVNKRCLDIFQNLDKKFTAFELEQFIGLSSKYSKLLFKLLMQFKSTGLYIVDKDKFRELLDIPKSYRTKDVWEKIIKPSVAELAECFDDLVATAEVDKRKRGYPVKGYRFKWTPKHKIIDVAQQKQIPTQKQKAFHNFQERDNDYDELQRKLLERSMGE